MTFESYIMFGIKFWAVVILGGLVLLGIFFTVCS
jgi:hypothetical protein